MIKAGATCEELEDLTPGAVADPGGRRCAAARAVGPPLVWREPRCALAATGNVSVETGPDQGWKSDISPVAGRPIRHNAGVSAGSELLADSRTPRVEPGRPSPQSECVHTTEPDVAFRVVRLALGLALWIAAGSLVLAIAEGLGAHPIRRLAVGIGLVMAIAAGLWQRDVVCAVLRRRPTLVLLVAAAELAAVALDGVVGGPYVAVTLTSIGLAAIVGPPRTVWLTVGLLEVGYVAAAVVDRSPASIVDSQQLGAVLGALLGYPFSAVVVLGFAGLFRRFVADAGQILSSSGARDPALTPALVHAGLARPHRPVGLLDSPGRDTVDLTAHELRVIDDLGRGLRPKEIAFAWGVSLPTVRKHIRLAKQKTRARTLPELAAIRARDRES